MRGEEGERRGGGGGGGRGEEREREEDVVPIHCVVFIMHLTSSHGLLPPPHCNVHNSPMCIMQEKRGRERDVYKSIKRAGYRCSLIMIEARSHGQINLPGFSKLQEHFHLPKKIMKELANV